MDHTEILHKLVGFSYFSVMFIVILYGYNEKQQIKIVCVHYKMLLLDSARISLNFCQALFSL